MFHYNSIKILFILLLTLSVKAQTIDYSDTNFIVDCIDRKISFKAISSADNQYFRFSDFLKYVEKSDIVKIFNTACRQDKDSFFKEARKTSHEECLLLEKDFYKKVEAIDKDEAVQMELTDALLNDQQYSGITEELILLTKKMQAYCLLRDSISVNIK